jgi:hypothetical protein
MSKPTSIFTSIFLSAREHGKLKLCKRFTTKNAYKSIEVSRWLNDSKTLWICFNTRDQLNSAIFDSDQIIKLAKMIPTLKRLLKK